jgi:CRISPR/Cas system-associated exonuclease Cas4 (RecB family)
VRSGTIRVSCASCDWTGRRAATSTSKPCPRCGSLAFSWPDSPNVSGEADTPGKGAARPSQSGPQGTRTSEQPRLAGGSLQSDPASPETSPANLDFIKEHRHLSFSQLSTYSSCGEKYRLRYVERVPARPQGAFLGGRAVHEAIADSEAERWWKDEANFGSPDAPAVARFREVFDREVGGAGEDVRWGGRNQGEDYPWWVKNGEFMLRRYRATRAAMDESGWDVVEGGVEMRVITELPGVAVPVLGYLDKFLMHDAGDSVVVDYSTGRVGGKDALQFATYARLVEKARGFLPQRGVAIYLRAPEAAKRVQDVPFLPLVEHVDESYATLVRGIEAGVFVPNPSSFCSSCAVNSACWYYQGSRPPE